jgi:hypothetical protein
MEKSGLLVKYTAIVNSEKADDALVEALIEVKVAPKKKEGFDGMAKQIAAFPEVKAVYLMSGAYDLAVFVEDRTLQLHFPFEGNPIDKLSVKGNRHSSLTMIDHNRFGVDSILRVRRAITHVPQRQLSHTKRFQNRRRENFVDDARIFIRVENAVVVDDNAARRLTTML